MIYETGRCAGIVCYNAPCARSYTKGDTMPTRPGLEQEIADNKRTAAGLQNEIQAIRGYISSNEHVMQSQPESLRAITQEGLAKARANLARKESELQIIQQTIATNQQILAKIDEVERKQAEVRKLEQDLDTITNLLEKARADLTRLEGDFLTLTGPTNTPQFDLIMSDGKRLALPTDRPELLIGCLDQADRIYPDVDLTPYGGKTGGVSRRHALLRYIGNQWTVTDLGSANGTFVNEVAIQPNVPFVIQDQAKLRFGAVTATLRSAGPPSKTVRL